MKRITARCRIPVVRSGKDRRCVCVVVEWEERRVECVKKRSIYT